MYSNERGSLICLTPAKSASFCPSVVLFSSFLLVLTTYWDFFVYGVGEPLGVGRSEKSFGICVRWKKVLVEARIWSWLIWAARTRPGKNRMPRTVSLDLCELSSFHLGKQKAGSWETILWIFFFNLSLAFQLFHKISSLNHLKTQGCHTEIIYKNKVFFLKFLFNPRDLFTELCFITVKDSTPRVAPFPSGILLFALFLRKKAS